MQDNFMGRDIRRDIALANNIRSRNIPYMSQVQRNSVPMISHAPLQDRINNIEIDLNNSPGAYNHRQRLIQSLLRYLMQGDDFRELPPDQTDILNAPGNNAY